MKVNPAHQRRKQEAAERALAVCEEIEWWMDSNAGWGPMIGALGFPSCQALARYLHRHGRHDLACRIEAYERLDEHDPNKVFTRRLTI